MHTIGISEPLSLIMGACEVRCAAGCCGLEAFDVHPQWIRAWVESDDPALLAIALEQIDAIIEDVSGIQGDFYSPLLNHIGSTDQWIRLLIEWKVAIENAPYSALPAFPQPESPDRAFRNKVLEALLLLGCGVAGASPIVGTIALFYWLGYGVLGAAPIAGIIVLIYWLLKRS
jgi:hypothetical protein